MVRADQEDRQTAIDLYRPDYAEEDTNLGMHVSRCPNGFHVTPARVVRCCAITLPTCTVSQPYDHPLWLPVLARVDSIDVLRPIVVMLLVRDDAAWQGS